MTMEEARQIIATLLVSSKGTEEQIGYIEGWFGKEDEKAFALAIEALSDTPTNTPTCNKKQVTGKLKNADDSLLKSDSDECKEQKSKLDCISRQQAIEDIKKHIESISTIEVSEEYISKMVISDSLLHRISALNAQGEKAIPIARELIRFKRFVDDMTPVIPAERTGKWYIVEYEYFTCDQCGEYVWNSAEYTQEARDMLKNGEYPNYCPNCGAKMDGDTE